MCGFCFLCVVRQETFSTSLFSLLIRTTLTANKDEKARMSVERTSYESLLVDWLGSQIRFFGTFQLFSEGVHNIRTPKYVVGLGSCIFVRLQNLHRRDLLTKPRTLAVSSSRFFLFGYDRLLLPCQQGENKQQHRKKKEPEKGRVFLPVKCLLFYSSHSTIVRTSQ